MAEKRQRWRGGKREREGERGRGMFHFRLMICTVHGPDQEEEEDQPTAAGRTDFWSGVPAMLCAAWWTETRMKVYTKQQPEQSPRFIPDTIRSMRHQRTLIWSDRPPPSHGAFPRLYHSACGTSDDSRVTVCHASSLGAPRYDVCIGREGGHGQADVRSKGSCMNFVV